MVDIGLVTQFGDLVDLIGNSGSKTRRCRNDGQYAFSVLVECGLHGLNIRYDLIAIHLGWNDDAKKARRSDSFETTLLINPAPQDNILLHVGRSQTTQ
jgi:hypothetical protein